jgi:hypothetical protein
VVNRLLVSSFLLHKDKETVNNILIKKMIISKNSDLYLVLKDFLFILDKYNQTLCFEPLLEVFEFVISPSDKLVNGAIYTP